MKIFTFEQFTNESLIKESHFKVGDKVKMSHGGEGIIVSLDKEDGADDEAYYNIELPNGDMMKHAPNELEKVNEGFEKSAIQKALKDSGYDLKQSDFKLSKKKQSGAVFYLLNGEIIGNDDYGYDMLVQKATERIKENPKKYGLDEKVNEASTEEMIKKEAISRLSDFFRISPNALSKFNFDGKDDEKTFNRMTPKSIHKFYKTLQDTLQPIKENFTMKNLKTINEFLNEGRSVNEAEKIEVGVFVRYKKDKDFTGGKVISINKSNAYGDYVKIHNWDGSTTDLPLKDLEYVKSWNESISEQKTGVNNLEMIGPKVDEILDAINKLNGAQLSGSAFKFRDNVNLQPVDKSGHVASGNRYSIEVIPTKGFKSPMPDENLYIRVANEFLEDNGFKCKIYKTQ